MLGFAARQALLAVLVALTVSLICFLMVNLSTDPAAALAGEGASRETIENIRHQYGFDRPLVVRYGDWLGHAVTGDLGESLYFKKPVSELMLERIGPTLGLGGMALLFALAISLPLGVAAAVNHNGPIDRIATLIAALGQAVPSFWLALMLIVLFGLTLRWLPISGSESFAHFIMPAMALGTYAMPPILRLVRSGMLDVLSADYIRVARAKGLLPHTVLFKHALRNAVIPVVSLAAVQFGYMLGGSVVIETIYALNGLGFLAYESIIRNDFPVIQAIVLVISAIYIVLTLLADLVNALLDPRLRTG